MSPIPPYAPVDGGGGGGSSIVAPSYVVGDYEVVAEDRWVFNMDGAPGRSVFLPPLEDVQNGYIVTIADGIGSASPAGPLTVYTDGGAALIDDDNDGYAIQEPYGSVTVIADVSEGLWRTVDQPSPTLAEVNSIAQGLAATAIEESKQPPYMLFAQAALAGAGIAGGTEVGGAEQSLLFFSGDDDHIVMQIDNPFDMTADVYFYAYTPSLEIAWTPGDMVSAKRTVRFNPNLTLADQITEVVGFVDEVQPASGDIVRTIPGVAISGFLADGLAASSAIIVDFQDLLQLSSTDLSSTDTINPVPTSERVYFTAIVQARG